jgi:CheY-like chemotaxis protein
MPEGIYDQTIIIADNDSMMRGLLRTVLQQSGRTLLLCANGEEAVQLAEQTLATLVLLDFRMPRMDGIEACRRIRELPRYALVPIVILTVFDGETSQRQARRAGATTFLAKPFSTNQLMAAINPLILAHKQQMELEKD